MQYGYDVLGRVKTETEKGALTGLAYTTEYGYDVFGNLNWVKDPASGITTMTYDGVDRLHERKLPNGITTTYEYDGLDRVKSIVHFQNSAVIGCSAALNSMPTICMNLESTPEINVLASAKRRRNDIHVVIKIVTLLLALAILSTFFVVINAGERGILMKFGAVQERILEEGLHLLIPIVHTVETLSVRVQNQEISAEASSKDLQDVYADVALNWHLVPEKVNLIFQRVGNNLAITNSIINPAVEEVLKAVMAQYTAEEIITRRGEVKAGVDDALTDRLASYYIAVDDISLVHAHFSKRFSDAVEAKQVAEQEAKRAEFVARKAIRQAEARVNLAKGEAEAQRLIRETLTPELLKKQAVERWDGKLPLIVGDETPKLWELGLDDLMQSSQK